MRPPINITAIAIPLLVSAAPVAADDAAHGQAIFDSQCVRCHRAGPKTLKIDPDQLQQAFNSVRQHRSKLTDEELAALTAYLRQTR